MTDTFAEGAALMAAARPERRAGVLRRLSRDPAALLAGGFLVVVIVAALLAPWIAPYDPFETNPRFARRPPSDLHWFGTDINGRDIFSRVLYGTRVTLAMAVAALVVGGGLGVLIGIVAAGVRTLDGWLMRLMDMLLSFPAILLGLAIAAVTGPGLSGIVLALSVATIPLVARLARASALVVLQQDYVRAARALGVGHAEILWRHVLANCAPAILVFMTLRLGQIMLLGAALSFLGLGAQPPTAELGTMAAQGRNALFAAPHISTIPSLVIFGIVLAFNVLGDALRDVLDPRLRPRA